MSSRIAYYPGDGIGPEVLSAGRRILEAVLPGEFEFEDVPWNAGIVKQTGRAEPEDLLDVPRSFDAIYLGAAGDTAVAPDHATLEPILRMRKAFRQYAWVRTARFSAILTGGEHAAHEGQGRVKAVKTGSRRPSRPLRGGV